MRVRFMTHVHHDLARVFEVVHIALELGQAGVGQIKRNADDGLPGGTSPFIGEVTKRTELVDALGLQFAIELVDESFERRTLESEPEFANGLGEYLLEFGSGCLEIAHRAIQSSTLCNQKLGNQKLANQNPAGEDSVSRRLVRPVRVLCGRSDAVLRDFG